MNIKQTVFTLIITAISLSSMAQKKVIDEIEAVVGDEIILMSELENQIISYQTQGMLIDESMRCQLFEEMLFQKLLINQAKLDSVEVTDSQVESEMNRRLRYFISQIGSEKKLEEYYQKSIAEIKDEFRELVKEQMLAQQMQQKITGGVRVTPSEVKEFYNNLPADSIPVINSQVEIAQILIKAPISEKAKLAAREEIESIRKRILNGESFSTLAVLYSDDQGSAVKGGELGFTGRAEFVPEFSAVAFSLKSNEISEVVETQFGYHIIQLIKREGEKVNVRHILIKPEIETEDLAKAEEKANKVYQMLLSDSLTFEEAAEKYSDDEDSKNNGGILINPQTGSSMFDIDQVSPQLFFIIDKMKEGEISKPVAFEMPDGTKGFRIVKLVKRTEPHRASLKTDYDLLQQAALNNKKNKVLKEWIENKTKSTYIQISDKYKNCPFENNWNAQPIENN
ncbi:MAG TPA: peptidylprolyl isomerase [Flavobacteriales bacterium]|nr:peptidylprolyl isomerase [Flavobacteriales bacterium]|tara:strand:- start:33310 stop:34668 length:1359 start_codon:yes stop_codon:yes gene_type:complete